MLNIKKTYLTVLLGLGASLQMAQAKSYNEVGPAGNNYTCTDGDNSSAPVLKKFWVKAGYARCCVTKERPAYKGYVLLQMSDGSPGVWSIGTCRDYTTNKL